MQYKRDERWDMFSIPRACNSEAFTDALVYVLQDITLFIVNQKPMCSGN